MAQHLSAEQIAKYRERSLLPGELLAVDSHLGGCEECRVQLSDGESRAAASGLITAIEKARGQHLSYEQMDAWVEDKMDQTERELVLAHIGLCAECARQLRAYESYAPVMSAPVNRETVRAAVSAPSASFSERILAFFRMPAVAVATLAIAAVAILTPILLERSERGRGVDSSVKREVRTDAILRPAALTGLDPNPDKNFEYPVSEVVQETQPILRWKPFAMQFTINVYNSNGMLIAHTQSTDTNWQVPVALDHGATYQWEIVADGATHRAAFRVLDEAGAAEIERVRSSSPSFLAMGTVAERYGLLSSAQQQFEAALKQQPDSAEAARMLRDVVTLRGR
jgi:hypothetical protein